MSATQLQHVRVHGLGLTDDFLLQLSDRAQTVKVEGANPGSYGLPPRTSLEEAIQDAWDDARKAWAKSQQYGTDTWAGWIRPLLKALDYTFAGSGASGGKYAVNHLTETGDVPLHFTRQEDLDRVTDETGLRVSPHGLMQGYLNATPEHLWGLVTNGETLRLLRDNAQVTRPAYVEFQIGEMLRTEDARAFRVLWLLLHRSRLKGAVNSPLEAWNTRASSEGVKARDSLRGGVEQAINHLGTGFLQANPDLLALTREDAQATTDLYRTCLKMVYQLVFLFVTEDRDLLFERNEDGEYIPDAQTRERARHYLTRALRNKATTLNGNALHFDAYAGWERLLSFVREGFAPLGLPALGSHLFALPDRLELRGMKLSNRNFYDAIRALSEITVEGNRRPVNYAGLDSEELGSIYESLLELVPRIQPGPRFELQILAGNDRKTTGSYYTPSSLIDLLLESALDPVIENATRDKLPEDAIAALKGLKVIDPACGSGHFLIAAARRIGARLSELEEETSQPSPRALRKATRTVIAHCIYGADINPMAIELAKVALWLESQDAGKPLAFLDHRLRVGNSLLGTTPDLMNSEDEIPEKVTKKSRQAAQSAVTLHLPDDAFVALEGDDKKTVAELKKGNKSERETAVRNALGQHSLFNMTEDLAPITAMVKALDKIEPESLSNVQAQESTWNAIQQNKQLKDKKLLADAWCAAFVLPKVPHAPAVTTATLHALKQNPQAEWLNDVRGAVAEAAAQYHFLHPHIEFPDVFGDAGKGGFDCVLGNPPWERTSFEDEEYFSIYFPDVLFNTTTALRKKGIDELRLTNISVYSNYIISKRIAEAKEHFYSSSGRYTLSAVGRINTFALFCDMSQQLLNYQGIYGQILPTGIATDTPLAPFWRSIAGSNRIIQFIEFENKLSIFKDVHPETRFTLLTFSMRENTKEAKFGMGFYEPSQVTSDSLIRIPANAMRLINPITGQIPTTSDERDLRLVYKIYQNSQPMFFGKESFGNAWVAMTSAGFSAHYSSERKKNFISVIEGKMISLFDSRFATFEGSSEADIRNGNPKEVDVHKKSDPRYFIEPRFYVNENEWDKFLKRKNDGREWTLVYRDVTNANNERTAIASVVPTKAFAIVQPLNGITTNAIDAPVVLAAINSMCYDFVIKRKISGRHFNVTDISQSPIPYKITLGARHFIVPRVLELTYTAYDLTTFARDLGYGGDPFIWNDERRFWLRAELDALYFILYGIARADVDYIMDTFPIVKRKDEAAHGSYRTKEVILSVYEELQTLGLERIGEYVSRVERLGLGGDVAGGWVPE